MSEVAVIVCRDMLGHLTTVIVGECETPDPRIKDAAEGLLRSGSFCCSLSRELVDTLQSMLAAGVVTKQSDSGNELLS